ncbi:retinaldehyde-binding protein 1-like, partial [Diaphorina citri]|uniref:Retinaldehyde-binding protein 1-like n=1 Tax=Diaphorina citri TaxID=121845 RepID=A0A1S4ESK4_DIACI
MVKNKQAKMEVSGGRRLLANKIFSGPDPIGRQKAKAEFNMTPDTTRQYIQELKLYLKQHTKLPDHIVGVNEDDWYENYLILNKNDIQRTKDNLEIYFKLKEILPEAYQERDSYSTVMMKSFRSTYLSKLLVAMMDVLLKEGVDWSSIVLILDTSKTKLGHLTKYPIFLMKKFFDYAWRAYPERIAQIHVIHPPAYLEYAMALFRPFLREKIRSRIMVHSKIDTLYDYVDKSLLPSDYGGDLPYTSVQING